MEQLPTEVLYQIFEYLTFSDKCALRQVSSFYYNILNYKSLNHDAVLTIDNHVLDKFRESTIDTILKAKRFFYKWTIRNITGFSILYPLFKKLGHNVTHLKIEACELLYDDLYQILPCLPNLKTLSFVSCAAFFVVPENVVISSLECLSFSHVNVLSDCTFPKILNIFPRLVSLAFDNCNISYSLSIFLMYYSEEENILSNLNPHIFTSRAIFAYLPIFAPRLVSLDLTRNAINTHEFKRLMMISTFKPRKLILSRCMALRSMSLIGISSWRETLISLDISHMPAVTDIVIEELCQSLEQLKYLNCSHCQNLTDEGVMYFNSLKQLVELDVSHCRRVTSYAVVFSLNCNINRNLKTLNILFLRYNGTVFPPIENQMPRLRELSITSLGWRDIRYIFKYQTKLTKLDAGCRYTRDNMLTGIDRIPPARLRRLLQIIYSIWCETKASMRPPNEPIDWPTHRHNILSYCAQKIDNQYNPDSCISNLKGLQYLNLSKGLLTNDIFFSGFRFPQLQVLLLAGTKITTKGIIILVAKCPAIETLDVSNTKVDDIAVEIITLGLKRLRNLYMKSCRNITNHALVSICRHAGSLKVLDITGCRGPISNGMVDNVRDLPFMKTVYRRNNATQENAPPA